MSMSGDTALLGARPVDGTVMVARNLSTRYLGLDLKNPLVVSACSLTGKVETLRRFEEAGAAAVVDSHLLDRSRARQRDRFSRHR